MNRFVHAVAAGLLSAASILGAADVSAQVFEEAAEASEPVVVETVPDTMLAGRLRAIFSNIEEFSAVDVAVTEGVVRLEGSVDRPDARRRVEELTASLDGVVYVVNEVEPATDVETRITPAVAKIQEYWDNLVAQLPVAGVALIVVLLFWIVSVVIGRWRRPAAWTGINPLLWGFVSRLLRAVLVAVGLLLAFDILGITSLMGAVLGTAGIVGLALGFAFQDIVENYLAGMLLSIRRPFSVNDLVRVGEFEGRIVRLTSRELVLLTFKGNHVRLPNSHVFKTPLTNFTINPRRLFTFDVGIGTDEDLQAAMRVGVEALQEMRGVMEDPPPFARVVELGESAVKVRYHGWVDQQETDFLKALSEAIRLVKTALEKEGIEMPEPIYRTYTKPLPERIRKAPEEGYGEDADRIDVEPDRKLDAEVFRDLRESDDENLLEQ